MDWNMKFKDLSRSKQLIFVAAILIIFGTIGYTIVNVDDANYRLDRINDKAGCVLTFRNGVLDYAECNDNLGNEFESPYPQGYTISDFNEEHEQTTEDYRFNINFTGTEEGNNT